MRPSLTQRQVEALAKSFGRSRATIYRHLQAGMPSDLGEAQVWLAQTHPTAFCDEDRSLILECAERRRRLDDYFGVGVSDALGELTAFALRRMRKIEGEGSRLGCVVTQLIEQAAGLPEPSYGWGAGPFDPGPIIAWAKSRAGTD